VEPSYHKVHGMLQHYLIIYAVSPAFHSCTFL
jgi:hypothetical protein